MLRFIFLILSFITFFSCDLGGDNNSYIEATAKLGNLSGALVKVYQFDNDGKLSLIDVSETTDGDTLDEIGKFYIPENKIKDDKIYLIEVSGGIDWDNDDDGIKNYVGIKNKGKIRAILTGKQLKQLNKKLKITLISELAYEYLSKDIKYNFSYENIKNKQIEVAKFLLKSSKNMDNDISYEDILTFDPVSDLDILKENVSNKYFYFAEKVHTDPDFYPVLDLTPAWIVGNYNVGFIFDLKEKNKKVFFGTQHGGFGIFDITDPLNGNFISGLNTQKWIWNVELFDNTAVLLASESMYFVDISDKNNPEIVFSKDLNIPGGMFADATKINNLLFVSEGEAGISVYDITDINNPIEVVNFKPCNFVWDVAVKGNYLYSACYDEGISVVDISHITNPVVVSRLDTDDAWDIEVKDNYVYVADVEGGVKIIDVSNPENPQIISVLKTDSYAFDVEVVNNKLYIADYEDGVYIVDISDPYKPKLKQKFDTPDFAYDVEVDNDFLYIAGGPSGFQIVDLNLFR